MNVYVFDIGSICIHGKELFRNFAFQQKYREIFTLKQIFEISEQLILEQSDEIFGVFQISWENCPWKQLSLVNDEEVISLSHAKVYVFSDTVDSKIHHNTELWTELSVSQWNSSGIFPRIHHIAPLPQSPRVTVKIERNTRKFTGRIIFMSMINDISW